MMLAIKGVVNIFCIEKKKKKKKIERKKRRKKVEAISGRLWAKALHRIALVCKGQDELRSFLLAAGDPACFREDPPAKSSNSPALTEQKMKPAFSLHQQISGA